MWVKLDYEKDIHFNDDEIKSNVMDLFDYLIKLDYNELQFKNDEERCDTINDICNTFENILRGGDKFQQWCEYNTEWNYSWYEMLFDTFCNVDFGISETKQSNVETLKNYLDVLIPPISKESEVKSLIEIQEPLKQVTSNQKSLTKKEYKETSKPISFTFSEDTEEAKTSTSSKSRNTRIHNNFKRNLELTMCRCPITGSNIRLDHCHIKPYAKCNTNSEREDGWNGLLLYHGLHELFDEGLISFTNEGKLLISDHLNETERTIWNKLIYEGRMCDIRNESGERSKYLSYHRNNIFIK